MTVAPGILHSDWIILMGISGLISGLGIIRFLHDWRRTDNIDVILLFVGSLFMTIGTVLSGQQDFINSTGQILTYQGEYWLVYVLWPWSIISWLLGFISVVILLVSWRRNKAQKFSSFSSSYY